jgi:hypothetical protein
MSDERHARDLEETLYLLSTWDARVDSGGLETRFEGRPGLVDRRRGIER